EKVYAYDGPTADIVSDPRVEQFADRVQQEQREFEKPKGAPQTLVELTGRAVSASRQGWLNARERLGASSDGQQPLPVSPETSGAQAAAAVGTPATPHPNRAQRASSAVGSFARKSYHCLRSLFRHCSDKTANGQPTQQ